MVKYYLSNGRNVETVEVPCEGCWIAMTKPTKEEVDDIAAKYFIDADDLKSALDTDERSRIQSEENYTMVLVNIPTVEDEDENELYDTIVNWVYSSEKYVKIF